MYPIIPKVSNMTQRNEQPVIGVTTKRGDAEWVENHTQNYLNVLREYGAVPVVLSPDYPAAFPAAFPDGATFTPDEKGRLPNDVLTHMDGLVLSGGGDMHPNYFGAEMNGANPKAIDLPRDELELGLSKAALALDMPIFGICRGCQVLNVAAGGGMVQHFDGHRSSKENPIYHDILVEPNSRFHKLVGVERLPSNTYHHQGLDHATLAPSFDAVGIADPDNWLVEVIESPRHQWVFGVQWHPERLYELSDEHRKLWIDFVETCRRNGEIY